MYWDDDIDLMAGKKQPAKLGRRAGQQQQSQSSSLESEPGLMIEAETERKSSIPLRPRKSGGWADEGIKSAKGRSTTNLIEEERFQSDQKNDSDDDVPVIPDIEELQDEIYSLQEDQTPVVSVNRATYKELDSELIHLQANQPSFGKLTDINLSLLTSKLQSEKDVQDPDEVWTLESLAEELLSINPTS